MARFYKNSYANANASRANSRARNANKKVKTYKYVLLGLAVVGFIAYKKGLINFKKA